MILGAPLLDFSSLFPKPIMAKNVLAIGAHLYGIHYPTLFKSKLDRLLPSFFDSLL